jgi:hypothetical protein
MSAGPISDSLRRFILTSVPSVPFVEALLLLRAAGSEPVTAGQIAQRLYLDERRAREVLGQLCTARIAETLPEGGYRYAPVNDVAALVEDLAECYRGNLVEVTEIIHSPTGRMAHHFADAFRWRKD